jgi:hypothetical protein
MRFQEMAAHCDAVGTTDDDMWMQRGLAVGPRAMSPSRDTTSICSVMGISR